MTYQLLVFLRMPFVESHGISAGTMVFGSINKYDFYSLLKGIHHFTTI